jgi:hypothetical protein
MPAPWKTTAQRGQFFRTVQPARRPASSKPRRPSRSWWPTTPIRTCAPSTTRTWTTPSAPPTASRTRSTGRSTPPSSRRSTASRSTALINTMDDVADLMQDSAETMALYDVRHMTEEIERLTDLSLKCCERVRDAVRLLPKIKPTSHGPRPRSRPARKSTARIDADRVMRSAMSKLFREEPMCASSSSSRPSTSCWKPSPTSARTWPTASRASSSKTPDPPD